MTDTPPEDQDRPPTDPDKFIWQPGDIVIKYPDGYEPPDDEIKDQGR